MLIWIKDNSDKLIMLMLILIFLGACVWAERMKDMSILDMFHDDLQIILGVLVGAEIRGRSNGKSSNFPSVVGPGSATSDGILAK